MLFWILLVVGVLSIVGACHFDKYSYSDAGPIVCIALSVITLFTVIIFSIFFISVQCDEQAAYAKNVATYESLVYQAENNIYDNDNDIGKEALMNEITNWNANLAYNREMMDNFWVGFLYYNFWDQLQPISLDLIQ